MVKVNVGWDENNDSRMNVARPEESDELVDGNREEAKEWDEGRMQSAKMDEHR